MNYEEHFKNDLINKVGINLLGFSDTSLGNMIKNIPNADLKEFANCLNLISEIMECVENFKALNVCGTIALNTVPHEMYSDIYIYKVLSEYAEKIEIKKGCEKLFEDNIKKLIEYAKENEEMFAHILDYGIKEYNEIMDQYSGNTLEEYNDKIEQLNDDKKNFLTEFIHITTMKNVKLYHGTSYDNYRQIKKDGIIRASDYSDGDYKNNDNIKELYLAENGFVFSLDSMDFSLRYCFGGERKNLIEDWAYGYNKEDLRKKREKNRDLGVIFEIDTTNYDVYFHKGKREFMIKGNVSISDTKPLFFQRTDDFEYITLSEDEIEKIWGDR